MSIVQPNDALGPIDHDRHYTKSHEKHFGAAQVTFPQSLHRKRRTVLDQYETNFCTEYGEATSGSYEQERDFSGEWETAAAGIYLGAPIMNGADPYPSMQVPTIMGYLPQEVSPFSLIEKGPEFVAQWKNWPSELAAIASQYRSKLIPYYIDGPHDIFDNVRNALYQAFLANEKGVVKAFGFWYESWNEQAENISSAVKGRIRCPDMNEQPVSRHRYTFIDFDTDIVGAPVLVAALTQGEDFGDRGFLYFDRKTINQVFAHSSENGLGLYINRLPKDNFTAALHWLQGIFAFLSSRVNIALNK